MDLQNLPKLTRKSTPQNIHHQVKQSNAPERISQPVCQEKLLRQTLFFWLVFFYQINPHL